MKNMKPVDSFSTIRGAMKFNGSAEKLKKYYETWSTTYDSDVKNEGYVGPEVVTGLMLSRDVIESSKVDLKNSNIRIMDAGCGTGLAGEILHSQGYRNIEGCDLSYEMAVKARETGFYVDVKSDIDLHTRNHEYEDKSYDAVICCGTFTGGHVEPKALNELIRIVRPGGIIALSVRKSYYETTDFEELFNSLIRKNLITLSKEILNQDYLNEEAAHYFAFRVGQSSK